MDDPGGPARHSPRPPEFVLHSFAVEDAPGDEVEATLTVANTGTGDGTFLAEVGNAAMSDQPELAVEVPAGETRTVTRRVRFQNVWNDGDDEPPTVVLHYRETRLERTLDAADGTATGTQTTTDR